MSISTFSNTEKVQYALKTAVLKTMTAPDKDIFNERAAPPRIFPTNIRGTPLIEIGKGDITSEQTYHANHNGSGTAGNLVDMNNPWSVLKFYRVIDPTTNRVTTRTAGLFLGQTSLFSKKTFTQIKNYDNPEASATSVSGPYKNWYYEGFNHSRDNTYTEGQLTEFDNRNGSGQALLDLTNDDIYKGVALAYSHTPVNTVVTTIENSEYLVPHLRLYVKVKTNFIGEQYGEDPDGDCLAFWNPLFRDSLGLESGCDIGIINGRAFNSPHMDGSYPSVIKPGIGEWFSQSTAGVIAFYAAGTVIENNTQKDFTQHYARENTVSGYQQYDNYPYLSFLKYTGNSGINMEIKYGTTQPMENNANNQLFINTAENTINRYNAADKSWIDIGGTKIKTDNNSVITDSSGVSIDISGVSALGVDLSGNVSVANNPDTTNNAHVVNYGFLNNKLTDVDRKIQDVVNNANKIEKSNNSIKIDSSGIKIDISGTTAVEIDLSSNVTINNEPTQSNHVATKSYVDALATGLKIKNPVHAATTQNIVDISTAAISSIDGVDISYNQRILVKDQTDKTENGIYVVDASNELVRSDDFDNIPTNEITGSFVLVEHGDVNMYTQWVCITPNININEDIGNFNIEFTKFSDKTNLEFGTGLQIIGNNVSIDNSIVNNNTLNSRMDETVKTKDLYGQPPAVTGETAISTVNSIILSWENPIQFQTALDGGSFNNISNNGSSRESLYIPLIKNIVVEYKLSTEEWKDAKTIIATQTEHTDSILYSHVEHIPDTAERVNDSTNMQHNLVNELVIFVGGDAGVKDRLGNDLSFSSKDIIKYTTDKKTYYCNPRTTSQNKYNVLSNTNYDFRIHCRNNLLDTNYNIVYFDRIGTAAVNPPTPIATADFNTGDTTTGFFAEFTKASGSSLNTINIQIPNSALTAPGVNASQDISNADADTDNIFWKDFEIYAYHAPAISNRLTDNSGISQWTRFNLPVSTVSNNITQNGNVFTYKTPSATTSAGKDIDISFNYSIKNKFFKFEVRARNSINQRVNGWSSLSDPYYLRYGRPAQPPKPSITLVPQTNNISYQMKFDWTWPAGYETSISDSSGIAITTRNNQDTHNVIDLKDYEFVVTATVNIIVTVDENDKFVFNNDTSTTPTFKTGTIYTFDQSHTSNHGHSLRFSQSDSSLNEYNSDASGVPGTTGAIMTFTPDTDATVYAYSIQDGIDMGSHYNTTINDLTSLHGININSSSTVHILVTVDENNKFVFNNDATTTPTFTTGFTYIFDQSDPSNDNHPLRFSQSDSSLNEYNSDASGVPGTPGAIMTFTPDTDTTVYAYSTEDEIDMGSHYNAISIDSYSTVNIAVTVDENNKFVFDNDISETPTFTAGVTYIFDQSDPSNNNHPLRFSQSSDHLVPYNLDASGTPGTPGAIMTFTPDTDTTVYVYSQDNIDMGSHYNNTISQITSVHGVSINPPNTVNIAVTVDENDKFVFNPVPTFTAGVSYVFNQSDPSNDGHPLRFSQSDSSFNEYNSDASGVPGTPGAIMTFTPDISGTVYAYSIQDGIDMGSNYNTTISQTTSVHGVPMNSPDTVNIAVTVDENNKFVFDNDISTFIAGVTYIFDQSDTSNDGHPLRFSQSDSSLNEYNSDASGVPGTPGAIMTFTPDTDTTVYVYSQDNIDMGSNYNTTISQTTSVHGVSINPSNTVNIAVTVDENDKFVFDNDISGDPTFIAGVTYIFDQSDPSNNNHPLRFSQSDSSLNEYNSDASGVPGTAGAIMTFTPDISGTVYAYCTSHGINMGSHYNAISINHVNIAVTVDENNKFVFDNDISGDPTFTAGVTYIFDQSDSSNDDHPLRFSQSDSSLNEYNSDASGVPGTPGAIMTFTPDISGTVYAYCTEHGINMGSYYNTTISQTTSVHGVSVNSPDTVNIAVTVDENDKFVFDNDISTFTVGVTYIFDQSDPSNNGHPLRFSQSDSSLNEYNSDASGIPGTAGAIMTFTPDISGTVYAYCTAHGINMGSYYNTTISQTTSVHGVSINSPNIENITVTVDENNKFVFNPVPTFTAGVTYIFDQSDPSNNNHPLRFSRSDSSLNEYNSDASGVPGTAGAIMTFTPDTDTTVYVYSQDNIDMGSHYNTTISQTTSVHGVSINPSNTVNIAVTVDENDKFVFNNDTETTPIFIASAKYIFDQSDSSNENHPLRFSQSGSSLNEYNSDASGTPGTAGATITFRPVTDTTVYAYSTKDGIDIGAHYNTTDYQTTSLHGISINTNTSVLPGERIQLATETSLDATPITETTSNNGHYFIPVTDEDKGFAYKVKFRVRNSVFSSGQDGGWSDYSENSNVLEPNPPNKVTHMNIKFVENGTSDRVTYSWAHPSSKGGANINIRGYELEYFTSDTQTYPVAVDIARSDRNPDTARNHVYNAADMRDHPFKFRVRARNFFKTGDWIDYHKIDPVAVPDVPLIFTSGTNSFEITNTGIVFKCREPSKTVRDGSDNGFTNYNSNNFNTTDAVSVIDTRLITDASGFAQVIDGNISVGNNNFQTFTFNIIDTNLSSLTNITDSFTASFDCKNVLNSNYSLQSSFNIQYAIPAPTSFRNAAYFTFNASDHNISLALRRSNAGLTTSDKILPISGYGSTKISNTVNQLEWQFKSDTNLSNVTTTFQSSDFKDTDHTILNIGTLTMATPYTITYRCRNKYYNGFYESNGECQIRIDRPTAPTVRSAVITIVDNSSTNTKNSITINWNKPQHNGLQFQHNGSTSLVHQSNLPNIYQYKLYIEDVDNSGVSYSVPINTQTSFNNNANTFYTLVSSDTFPILPDTSYKVCISAFNQYYREAESDKSNFFNVIGSTAVPKTISGYDRHLTDSYKPHISDIGGAYAGAGTSDFRILNDFDNPASMSQPASGDRHRIRNLNTITTVTPNITTTPVLLNNNRNKPGTNDIMQFDFKITGSGLTTIDASAQTISRDSSAGVYPLVDGSNNTYVNVDVGEITDIFEGHRNDNKEQWYETASLEYTLNKNTLKGNEALLGKKISRIETKFTYLGTSPTEITSQIDNLYFDVIAANAVPTASITSVTYTSPYTVLGIPMLRTEQSHDINVKLEISNRSQYYVMHNCATLYLGTADHETYLPKHTLNFGSQLEAAADWPTHRKMQTKNSGIDMVSGSNEIKDVNNYSKDIKVRLSAKNIAGTMATITSHEKFIYDGPTHDVLQNLGNPGTYTVQAARPGPDPSDPTNTDHVIAVTRLAILQMPHDFDPLQNTFVSNSPMTVDNITPTSNRALLYRGYFQSPATFKNASSKGFGTDLSNYHSSLVDISNNYVPTFNNSKYFMDPTAPENGGTGFGNTIETTTSSTYFKDYYKWQVYKYTWKNSSTNSATVSKFKIRLGDNNNTNISFSDLYNVEPRKGAACEIWVKTVAESANISSNWLKLTYGSSARFAAQPLNQHSDNNFYGLSANVSQAVIGLISNDLAGTYRELEIGFHGTGTSVANNTAITHYIAVGLRNDQHDKYIRNIFTSSSYV